MRRTPDDGHLLNDSSDWMGNVRLLSGGDYVQSKSTAISVIAHHYMVVCTKCEWPADKDYVSISQILMERSYFYSAVRGKVIKSAP